jgi:hypothetical protein
MGFPIRLEVWVEPLVMGLEAERSWGPSRLERGFQSGLPVGFEPLVMGLEAERSWGPSPQAQGGNSTLRSWHAQVGPGRRR